MSGIRFDISGFELDVNHHARTRARERFPGFKSARIKEEVREAFAAGRVSKEKPATLAPPSDPSCLYVWTEDGERIYAVKADSLKGPGISNFIVVTTMKARAE